MNTANDITMYIHIIHYMICHMLIPVQEVLGLQAGEDGAGGGGVAAAGWLAARPRHRGQVLHRPHEDQGERGLIIHCISSAHQ